MKGALATTRGWINPRTGELLKAQKMTQEQADLLNGDTAPVQTLHEAPSVERVITEEEVIHYYDDEDEVEEEDDLEEE